MSRWALPGSTFDAPDPGHSLAAWLDPLLAVRLRSALDTLDRVQTGVAQPPLPQERRRWLAAVQRMRETWGVAVDAQALEPETPEAWAAVEALWPGHVTLSGFERYRRVHLEWQRQMAATVTPLRHQVRRMLAKAGGRWQPLAAMDALFESLLEQQEAKAAAQVLVLLEQRHEQQVEPLQDGSLKKFFNDWQALVDAELDLRLQPVQGMLASCEQEV